MTQYYISKTVDLSFEETLARITEELKKEGFGILTEIDMRPYKILGACNPPFAYKAVQTESHIGLLLPCNVIVQDAGAGKTEVAAIDPVVSMSRVENPALEPVAREVRAKLQCAIDSV